MPKHYGSFSKSGKMTFLKVRLDMITALIFTGRKSSVSALKMKKYFVRLLLTYGGESFILLGKRKFFGFDRILVALL